MALITKPNMQQIWASGGDIVEPSDLKKQQGWTVEVPPHQFENWIQNRQDEYLAHINQRGIPAWDGLTNYLASGLSYVQGTDGRIYKSVAASGPASVVSNPVTDATDTYWTIAFADVGAFLTQSAGDTRYTQRTNNLSDVTNATTARTNLGIVQATETAAGLVELATAAETTSGSLNNRAVHPAGLKVELDKKANIENPSFSGGVIVGATGLGGTIELGRTDGTAGNAFIDFHNGAAVTDYDARIIAPSGSADGTVGGGTLQIVAKNIQMLPSAGGSVTAPTAATGNNTTQVATTAFVQAQLDSSVPAATDTVAGKVELATNAEAQTGTDTTRAVTPANLNSTVLGMGQTWQDVTGSRASGTNYTNSTGKPICIAVSFSYVGSGTASISVGGLQINRFTFSLGGTGASLFAFVPRGVVYQATGTITSWTELR